MSREKLAYRDNLERIIEAFPNQEVLTVNQVSKFLRRDQRTIKKILPVKKGLGISVATLARYLS